MSTLQFPASPFPGQSFTAENGVTYTYDPTGGGGWTANNPIGIDDEYVNIDGDTMTGDLVLPNLEASGNISADGDIQSTSQNGGQLAGFRNQLINGDMNIWQRGTSFPISTVLNEYCADRWETNGQTRVVTKAAGFPGFPNALAVSGVTAGAAYIVQHIELALPNDFCQFKPGSTWTLSYWLRDNTSGNPSVDFRGNIQGADQTLWPATGPVEAIETSGSWTRYAQTFTAATFDSSLHNRVTVYISAANGNTTLFTGCQLEPGPVATPFEHRPMGTELALCQRYYFKLPDAALVCMYSPTPDSQVDSAIGVRWGYINHPVIMRVTPTVTGDIGGATAIIGIQSAYGSRISCGTQATNKAVLINAYAADAEL